MSSWDSVPATRQEPEGVMRCLPHHHGQSDSKTVLVVDDEKDIRDVVRILLEGEGYEVVTAEDGAVAIDALESRGFSAVITDIMMPRLDGIELLKHIAANHEFLPVIMLTGYVDVDMAVEAMKSGSVDYVTKPIRRAQLLQALEEALANAEREMGSFQISHVYLLTDGGKLIFSKDLSEGSSYDPDVFSSMLTAVRMFIEDSFRREGGEVKSFEYGDFRIILEDGDGFFLVVVGRGRDTRRLRWEMRETISEIEKGYGDAISEWRGNADVFEDIETEFARLLVDEVRSGSHGTEGKGGRTGG